MHFIVFFYKIDHETVVTPLACEFERKAHCPENDKQFFWFHENLYITFPRKK